jgi:hypothetical protein
MNAGSDSSIIQKSLVHQLENIEKNPQYKFIENEGQNTKRVNMLLENLSRQDHKSHLTDNKSQNRSQDKSPKQGSAYLEELA